MGANTRNMTSLRHASPPSPYFPSSPSSPSHPKPTDVYNHILTGEIVGTLSDMGHLVLSTWAQGRVQYQSKFLHSPRAGDSFWRPARKAFQEAEMPLVPCRARSGPKGWVSPVNVVWNWVLDCSGFRDWLFLLRSPGRLLCLACLHC